MDVFMSLCVHECMRVCVCVCESHMLLCDMTNTISTSEIHIRTQTLSFPSFKLNDVIQSHEHAQTPAFSVNYLTSSCLTKTFQVLKKKKQKKPSMQLFE